MRSPAAVLGLGTAPLGGLLEHVSPQAANNTLERAWSLGVRFFDTAPLYGSGVAEERLGRALAGHPRKEYTVSTKVGRVLQPGAASPEFRGAPPLEAVFDFSAEGIRRSLAGSLRRLRVDAVDLLLLHDPEQHMEKARRAVETARELSPRVGVGTNTAASWPAARHSTTARRRPLSSTGTGGSRRPAPATTPHSPPRPSSSRFDIPP